MSHNIEKSEPANQKEIWTPIIITLILLTVSFVLHKYSNSTMWQDSDMWDYRLKVHADNYPFRIRHFTSVPLLFFHEKLGLPIRETFFILQFSLAFIIGISFYNFLRTLKFNRTWSNIGLVMLLTAYPIMAAHFEPVFTWDDFWVYLFGILTFTSIIKRRFLLSGSFFLLGCLAREQNIILFPAYVWGILFYSEKTRWSGKTIYILFPFVIWALYYFHYFIPGSDPNRLKYLTLNLENFASVRDTTFSWFISFGFMWLASIMAWFRLIDHSKNKIVQMIFWGFILTVPTNTILTLYMTFARETRIFFPPFIFVIPLVLLALIPLSKYFANNLGKLHKLLVGITFTVICLIAYYLVANIIFPEFQYRQSVGYSQIWAAINFSAAFFIFGIYLINNQYRRVYSEIENEWCREK